MFECVIKLDCSDAKYVICRNAQSSFRECINIPGLCYPSQTRWMIDGIVLDDGDMDRALLDIVDYSPKDNIQVTIVGFRKAGTIVRWNPSISEWEYEEYV